MNWNKSLVLTLLSISISLLLLFSGNGFGETKRTPQQQYDEAKAKFKNDPGEMNTIWFGRRAAYLGNYDEAIAIFSEGIRKFPTSYKLYRHRGHRYISTRKFGQAIADFKKAAQLIKGVKLLVEPDGNPNRYNIPVSNTQFNIWYHLGLAHYLKGEYKEAEQAYRQCLKWSNNDDCIVSTADWLYMTLRRMNKKEEAENVLTNITPKMKLLESASYHNRLLMYKGLKNPESLLNNAESKGLDPKLDYVTQGYGVGNWYLYNGNPKRAKEIFKKVIDTGYRNAFAYIAAEIDLKNNLK